MRIYSIEHLINSVEIFHDCKLLIFSTFECITQWSRTLVL